jgi:hypothetical protein
MTIQLQEMEVCLTSNDDAACVCCGNVQPGNAEDPDGEICDSCGRNAVYGFPTLARIGHVENISEILDFGEADETPLFI